MINLEEKKAFIWDWNGTILNDTEYCVNCMNLLLRKRNIPTISIDKYKEVFTFPVEKYYHNIGFDFNKEDFAVPAMEFINHYLENLEKTDIFDNSINTLEFFKNKGVKQYVLSAMEHNSLIKTLTQRKLIKYFSAVAGIDDHYARSKTESGIKLINSIGVQKSEILLIGDTIHDFEVANKLGIDSVLIANGHQSKSRLLKETPNVINTIIDLTEMEISYQS